MFSSRAGDAMYEAREARRAADEAVREGRDHKDDCGLRYQQIDASVSDVKSEIKTIKISVAAMADAIERYHRENTKQTNVIAGIVISLLLGIISYLLTHGLPWKPI